MIKMLMRPAVNTVKLNWSQLKIKSYTVMQSCEGAQEGAVNGIAGAEFLVFIPEAVP
jgi:hypothetical protein